MNPIKTSIDEALETMEVTDELKERTIRRIRRQSYKEKSNHQFRFVMRGLTLVASFTMIMVISLSYVFKGNTPESEALKNYKLEFPNRVRTDLFSTSKENFNQSSESSTEEEVDEEREDSYHSQESE